MEETKKREKKVNKLDPRIRERLNWSQQDLADKANVSRGTVVAAENGYDYYVSNAIKMADALGVSLDEMFGRANRYVYKRPGMLCFQLEDFDYHKITGDTELQDEWGEKKKIKKEFYRFDQDFEGRHQYIAIRENPNKKSYKEDHANITVIDILWKKFINKDMSRPYECLISKNGHAFYTTIGLIKHLSDKYQSKEYFYYDRNKELAIASQEEIEKSIIGVVFEKIKRCTPNDIGKPFEMDEEEHLIDEFFSNEDNLSPMERYGLSHYVVTQEEADNTPPPPKKKRRF